MYMSGVHRVQYNIMSGGHTAHVWCTCGTCLTGVWWELKMSGGTSDRHLKIVWQLSNREHQTNSNVGVRNVKKKQSRCEI